MIEYLAMLANVIPESEMLSCNLRQRVLITLGLASNKRVKPDLNTQLKAGFVGFERSFAIYYKLSCRRRSARGISLASTCRLVMGEVRKAPRQVRHAALCTRSRLSRADIRAEPYTTQP